MPSALDRPAFTAGGNIAPATFVTLSNTADFTVLACNTTLRPFGVAHDSTEEWPHTSPAQSSNFAASAGKELTIRMAGETAMLKLGGTVEAGKMLKSDANGAGVEVGAYDSGNVQYVGAISLRAGNSGELVEVFVTQFVF